MARDTDQENRPVIIKKYANRRLYNTDTSTYVTLEDLAEMVRSERDFVVYDAKTGEDLTHSVLTQIIVEQESRGTNLLPIGFLRQLIRFYGDSMQMLVPSYLEYSIGNLTSQQQKFRDQIKSAMGGKELPGGQMFGALARDKTVPDTIRARSVQIASTLGVDVSGALPPAPAQ